MTSFVNLMASDVWSEADISRRTEAMVRQHFSADAETIINRKLQGVAMGQYHLSSSEKDEIARFRRVVFEAKQAGDQARADMALLHEVLDAEPTYLRLRQPVVEPEVDEAGAVVNQVALDQDAAEREAAERMMETVSMPALELLVLRNPESEPEPEPEPTAEGEGVEP